MRRTWKVLRSLWQTVTMSPISSSKDSAVIACKSTSLPLSADYSMWTSASSASCCIRDLSDLEVLERGEKSNLWWFGGRGIHIARVYRTCLNFFLHTSPLFVTAEQKRTFFLWRVCRFRCFKNISRSHTETANPWEKRYWILIMHTTSLHY